MLVCAGSSAERCTSGFPDMNLLVNRAAQISEPTVGDRLDSELYLMPNATFNRSGSILSLVLAVSIRTVTNSRNSYPQIHLWRPTNDTQGAYVKVNGSERRIILGPSDFSTSGIIEYPLDPPIKFVEGDILGCFQPPASQSVVRMYSITQPGYVAKRLILPALEEVTISNIKTNETETILDVTLPMYPITGRLQCWLHRKLPTT